MQWQELRVLCFSEIDLAAGTRSRKLGWLWLLSRQGIDSFILHLLICYFIKQYHLLSGVTGTEDTVWRGSLWNFWTRGETENKQNRVSSWALVWKWKVSFYQSGSLAKSPYRLMIKHKIQWFRSSQNQAKPRRKQSLREKMKMKWVVHLSSFLVPWWLRR